jgi:hypothetical protein
MISDEQLDSDFIYWARTITTYPPNSPSTGVQAYFVERVAKAGGPVDPFLELEFPANALAQDDLNIYVLHLAGVTAAPKAGGPEQHFQFGLNNGGGLFVDDQWLYWGASNQAGIAALIRTPKTGDLTFEHLAEAVSSDVYNAPELLGRRGTSIYWLNAHDANQQDLWKTDSVTGQTTSLGNGFHQISNFIVDDDAVYFDTLERSVRVTTNGGVGISPTSYSVLAVDETYLYGRDPSGIFKLRKEGGAPLRYSLPADFEVARVIGVDQDCLYTLSVTTNYAVHPVGYVTKISRFAK